MRWFLAILSLVVVFACEDDHFEEVPIEQNSFMAFAGRMALKPQVSNNSFWITYLNDDYLYFSELSADGSKNDLFEAGTLLPSHITTDNLMGGALQTTSTGEHLFALAYDTVLNQQSYLAYQHVKFDTEGTVLWQVQNLLELRDNNTKFLLGVSYVDGLSAVVVGNSEMDATDPRMSFVNFELYFYDSEGGFLRKTETMPQPISPHFNGLVALPSGKTLMVNVSPEGLSVSIFITIFSAQGVKISDFVIEREFSDMYLIYEDDDGLVCVVENNGENDNNTTTLAWKMDFSGQTIWEKTFENNSGRFVPYTIQKINGNYHFLGCYSNKYETFDEIRDYVKANLAWVVLDAEGKLQWRKTISSDNPTVALAIQQDDALNWTILAARSSFATTTDIALYKFNQDGELIN